MNEMDEYTKRVIADKAKELIKGVENGLLFGYPIDMNNPDMVLFAVWSKAIHEEQLKHAHTTDLMFEMIGIRK